MSVVIPVYNGGPHIEASTRSVFEQRLGQGDIEIILVDDGSTDDSYGLLCSLLSDGADRAIGMGLVQQPNMGTAAARNAGFQCARGEFISFLDQDDTWPADKLQWQLGVLHRHPELVMVSGRAAWVDSEGRVLGHYGIGTEDVTDEILFAGNPIAAPGAALIRAERLAEVGGFDRTIWGADDWDLWMRLQPLGRIRNHETVALHQLQHPAQASRDVERMALNARTVLRKNLRSKHFRAKAWGERRHLARAARVGYAHTYGWVPRVRMWRNLRAGNLGATVRDLPLLWWSRSTHLQALQRSLSERYRLWR